MFRLLLRAWKSAFMRNRIGRIRQIRNPSQKIPYALRGSPPRLKPGARAASFGRGPPTAGSESSL